MPKRLLPKPSAAEVNQPLKVKSKSTTNIAAKRSKPLKPTMSLVNIDIGEGDHSEISTTSEKSRTELSSKLYQEFHKRKQATELVQQLQQDYDKLLSKYAQAELTIDQLRLGATVTLHAASPTPSQALAGALPGGQQPQMIQMGQIGRGVKSPSPFQGSLGVPSPLTLNESVAAEFLPDRNAGHNDSRFSGRRTESEASLVNGHAMPPQSADRRDTSADGAEGVKMGLTFHAQTLDQRMDSFQALLDAGQGMTHDEQERVFDKIRNDHETLRKDYLRAKEDYNARKRSTAVGDVTFDDNKELEGELFKLGMKFDEIHEKVEEKRKEKHSQRQPFATNRRQSDSDVMTSGMSDQETRSVDQMKKKIKGTKAGVDMLEPKQDEELQKNLKRLHDEYNALMDRYRRLKQMAQTPERDQEIDNLVRKLHQISEEEPVVFPMPHELEGSLPSPSFDYIMISLAQLFSGRNSSISSSSTYVSHDTSIWDEETDTEATSRWEELQRGEEDGRSFSRRQSEVTVAGRRQSKDVQPFATTENKHITKGRDTPDHTGSNSSSLHRSDLEMNGAGRLNDSSVYSSRSSLSSRHDSTFDRDSPTPRLPRPRRHDHPDRRSGNLKKRPEGASMSSLQDSGISDYEGATGRDRNATGPLSNLPGPGTFKQMTKQRHAGDADSGFIGSMVGSDVSQGHLSARQQQQQQQPTLRLRQPSDSSSERPRSRSRPDDTHSITSSRSGRRSQDSARPRTRRDQAAQSRDYTDDSYTLTTESEMSFDIPERPGSRRGRNHGHSRGSIDRAIQEEEEERPRSILSNSSRSSRRSQQQKTPTKPLKPKQNVSFSSKSDQSEDEATPKHTPNQSFNDSREVFSSEEDTPREQIKPVVERLNLQEPATITRQEEAVRPPTPARKEAVRPPTPGVKTPRSERSATPVRRQDAQRIEAERPGSREELQRSEVPRMTEDRAVGSDSDDTVKDSVATAGTRGSESSEKFKLLQEEIGHLREEFFRAMQQKQHNAPPPPAPPQPQPEGDQYFDPTEDPYAFMRGPRRRANSFSGAAARDWDDWWKYPLNQQVDDIPLGYAAADSYNQSRPVNAEVQEARTRSRRKMRRKYRRTAESEAQTLNDQSDSDQAPSRVTASTVTDEQLYNYYVPQYYSSRTQTTVPPVYYTPNVPPRIQRYSSQPNLLQNSTLTTAPPPPVQTQNVPTTSYATPISAGYNRLRSSLRQPRQRTSVPRQYSYDDMDARNQEPIGYIVTNAPPPPAHNPPPPPAYMERTQACPLCGGAGYHTHGEYVYDAPSERPTMGYLVHDTPRRRPRRRSKSASRVQDYSPQGRSRSRYVFREYVTESSSAESDDDIVYRRRSRSLGRRSRRKTRKYKKVKPGVKVVDNDLSVTPGDGASPNTANNVPVGDTTLHNISASNVANLSSNTLLTRIVTPVHMTAPVNVTPAHMVTPVQVTTSVNVTPARVLTPVQFVTPVSSVANNSMFTPVAGNLSNTPLPRPSSSLDVVLPEVLEESQEYEDALNQSLNLTEEIGDLTYKMMGTVKSELAKSKRRKDFGSSYW
ncbi:hypothetical protein FSP39_005595 [Pinctada imbricata]|uniref:AKNA n=1 Tax=Pinctada imbricata TaxID=66713 RepID=A0AA89BQI7_PINIB|nr:hypothetical protein FSP39_005595 [Pinctada imbricata]